MNEPRLTLKHPSGFFAAGSEMKDALSLLSDGAFKIYVYVCLQADRHTAQLRFRMAELAQATGHSTRSLTTYLKELRRQEIALVCRANNQHETGRIEIHDRFWPYDKQLQVSLEDPEQALFVTRLRGLFLEQACVRSTFSAADEKLATAWYRSGITIDVIGRTFLLGCARKYVALLNHGGGSQITALQYFASIIEEVQGIEPPLDYWRYLALRVRKMDQQWRAHAKLAAAAPIAD
jgi:hypothetical protein